MALRLSIGTSPFEQSHTVLKMRIALTGEIGMASPVLLEGGLQIIWKLKASAKAKMRARLTRQYPSSVYSPLRLEECSNSSASGRRISKSRSGRSFPPARNCRAREYPDCLM
ncbi:hypothetical protein FFR93_21630 [Rhizobium sp. MHM7A]|nr:hypothetical protein FFR93_21630 [Rhizobium sp. MHM7A]